MAVISILFKCINIYQLLSCSRYPCRNICILWNEVRSRPDFDLLRVNIMENFMLSTVNVQAYHLATEQRKKYHRIMDCMDSFYRRCSTVRVNLRGGHADRRPWIRGAVFIKSNTEAQKIRRLMYPSMRSASKSVDGMWTRLSLTANTTTNGQGFSNCSLIE